MGAGDLREEGDDVDEVVIEEEVDAEVDAIDDKACTRFAKPENASGTKARNGVASTMARR